MRASLLVTAFVCLLAVCTDSVLADQSGNLSSRGGPSPGRPITVYDEERRPILILEPELRVREAVPPRRHRAKPRPTGQIRRAGVPAQKPRAAPPPRVDVGRITAEVRERLRQDESFQQNLAKVVKDELLADNNFRETLAEAAVDRIVNQLKSPQSEIGQAVERAAARALRSALPQIRPGRAIVPVWLFALLVLALLAIAVLLAMSAIIPVALRVAIIAIFVVLAVLLVWQTVFLG
ncbi:MAG: hypothetical protein AAB360_02655 [Patescibacteria group bacterium]